MSHWIVKNIQLNKQFLHYYVIYHGMAMPKQMEFFKKLHNSFHHVNLNCTMNYLLQHYFKTLRKIQLLIDHMKIHFQEIMILHIYL